MWKQYPLSYVSGFINNFFYFIETSGKNIGVVNTVISLYYFQLCDYSDSWDVDYATDYLVTKINFITTCTEIKTLNRLEWKKTTMYYNNKGTIKYFDKGG